MDPREFKQSFENLKEEFRDEGANPQSFELKGCRNCGSCMFCKECDFCYRCNYCEQCDGCSECTHCTRCSRSHTSAYCTDCDNCINSKYLDQCESCSDCTYCFGCVGLSRKDFHILNEPYGRNEYFRIVEKLKKQLRKK